MQVIHSIEEMQSIAIKEKQHKKIALVPTMGYLHEGHLSLVKLAKQHADIVIVSIFVNPTQFGANEDLDNYPKDFEKDRGLCEAEHVDYLFHPNAADIYPEPFYTELVVTELKESMCGISRKTHFDGVTLIVAKLINICQPHLAVFGQKDYQQFLIIQQMAAELNMPVKVISGATVREDDGLAKSSRNKYLNDDDRKNATLLYQSLQEAKEMIESGSGVNVVKEKVEKNFKEASIKLDYFEIKNAQNLQDLTEISGAVLLAIAAYVGQARLIDNIVINI